MKNRYVPVRHERIQQGKHPMNSEEWLTKLIAFNTTSLHSNLPLIDFIGNWLDHLGITVSLTYNSTKNKANLFASLPAHDKSLKGGSLLRAYRCCPCRRPSMEDRPFLCDKDQRPRLWPGSLRYEGLYRSGIVIDP